MPIEIKELVVKAVVEKSKDSTSKQPGKLDEKERQEIIKDCVEQVLKMLRYQNER